MRHETRTICAEPENELDYQRRMALAYQAEARDLRASLAERDAKIRELVVFLTNVAIGGRKLEGYFHEGRVSGIETALLKIHGLGLITEDPK